MKCLIIRFSSIGDIVLTSPIIRCVKNQIKDIEIHFLVKERYAHIITYHPSITKIYTFYTHIKEILPALQEEKYDILIDLHKNYRSYYVRQSLNTATYSFRKLTIRKLLCTQLHYCFLPSKHIVDRYFEGLKQLHIQNDHQGLDFFIPSNTTIVLPDICKPYFIAIVVGASYYTKKIPLSLLQDICKLISYPIVLLGSTEDEDTSQSITKLYPNRIWNACGIFNIYQSALCIKQASLVISSDTGLMHIAAAFKKNMITIWGSTIPEFGMYPYYGDHHNILHQSFEVNNLSCRPCNKIGKNSCPKKHFKCMLQQPTKEIAMLSNYWMDLFIKQIKDIKKDH